MFHKTQSRKVQCSIKYLILYLTVDIYSYRRHISTYVRNLSLKEAHATLLGWVTLFKKKIAKNSFGRLLIDMAYTGEVQFLVWVSAAVILLTLLVITIMPFLSDYIHKWTIMKPIPGVSPCFPLIGNALQFKPSGRGRYIML